MPFVQGKFDEDFAGIHYGDNKLEFPPAETTDLGVVPDMTFPPAEPQDSGLVPDLAFPPVEVPDSGIIDLEFPSTDNVVVQQPLVDENGSVGVLSRIRGWLGKE